jgi:hypothetical protein
VISTVSLTCSVSSEMNWVKAAWLAAWVEDIEIRSEVQSWIVRKKRNNIPAFILFLRWYSAAVGKINKGRKTHKEYWKVPGCIENSRQVLKVRWSSQGLPQNHDGPSTWNLLNVGELRMESCWAYENRKKRSECEGAHPIHYLRNKTLPDDWGQSLECEGDDGLPITYISESYRFWIENARTTLNPM